MVEMVARCAAAASRAAAEVWVVWRRAEIGKIMAILLFGGTMVVLNVAAAAIMVSTAMTMNGGEIR